ncbi:MAG: ArsC family transcriptional regulator [candidate division Zixibacteria bacterium]|nr:ArsC family transcriptional regulator [candidate division Zixibacteria bacterium]
MIIQVFGTKKCKNTQKAIRFFKERRINIQFVDLSQKGVSPGELRNICRSVPLEDLIDTGGKEYERQNLMYLQHNIEERLLDYPLLFRTPIVRTANGATVGYEPDVWKAWVKPGN